MDTSESPKQRRIERRISKRYCVLCPIEYAVHEGDRMNISVTLNISDSGALLNTRELLPIGINLVVKVSFMSKAFFIKSEVVHVNRNGTDESYNIGVKFIRRSREFVEKFYEEIENIISYRYRLCAEKDENITLSKASLIRRIDRHIGYSA